MTTRPLSADVQRSKALPATKTGVTQYLQLASVLRHQIQRGELGRGQQLPTVIQLAEQYQVARITARQAYGLLSSEGLVVSQRGKGTFVADGATGGPDQRLHHAINDPRARDVRFDVLEDVDGQRLPASLQRSSTAYDTYAFIRKIHLHDDEPFCLAEIYVASEIYRRFPPGVARARKIVSLLPEYAVQPLSTVQQITTVAPADSVLAEALGCSFVTPIAHIERRVFDVSGRIALAGRFWYRGDRFVTDVEMPYDLWIGYRGAYVPDALTQPAGDTRAKD